MLILAIGVLTLLAGTSKLGAFVGLNGWLPLKPHIETCRSQKDLAKLFEAKLGFNSLSPQPEEAPMLQTPIFLAHTTDDEIIDVQLGQQARDVLLGLGMKPIWKEEEEGGDLGMLKTGELDGVVAFLQGVVGLLS